MNGYMISIVGAVVIAIYSLIVCLVFRGVDRLAMRFFPNGLARGCQLLLLLLALVLLSLPWLEEAWIVWHFNQACQDAGVKVYKQVEVEGYLDATSRRMKRAVSFGESLIPMPLSFELQGYQYSEEALRDGGSKLVKRKGDYIVATFLEEPKSRYIYKYHYYSNKTSNNEFIGWKLRKLERQVVDRQTEEILGRDTVIKRVLPTHEALIMGMFGPPIAMCLSYEFLRDYPQPSFPEAVLKPIAKPQS